MTTTETTFKKYTVHRIELIHYTIDVMAESPENAITRADTKDNWDEVDWDILNKDKIKFFHDRQEVYSGDKLLLTTIDDPSSEENLQGLLEWNSWKQKQRETNND